MKNKEKDDDYQLLDKLKAIMNDLKCPNSHPIKRICDNSACQSPALFCIENQCEDCNNTHEKCRSYSFQMFTKLVQKRSTGTIAEFLDKIIEIENGMIDAIRKNKRKLSPTFVIDQLNTSLDKKYYKLVQDIYKYKNSQAINGRQANELFQRLQETQIQAQSRQEELLQTFNQQAQRIQKQYLQVKSWIYEAAFGQQRYKKKTKEKTQDILTIQSKILNIKNDQTTLKQLVNSTNKKIAMFSKIIEQQLQLQDKIFLREMFTLPNVPSLKFQLAFRASQNNFSATRFHQVCDNIEDTFVVIRNQFGKTFGGFTSLTWFGDNAFKNDQNNTSFLLSFDQRIKMTLFNRSKAIYCSQSLGPTFGGQANLIKFFNTYDLQIGDKCHTNASSSYDYPRSYQFFQRSTDPFNIFGTQKGKKFKIQQYEVFKVSFSGI